jgi:hypothetical protein
LGLAGACHSSGSHEPGYDSVVVLGSTLIHTVVGQVAPLEYFLRENRPGLYFIFILFYIYNSIWYPVTSVSDPDSQTMGSWARIRIANADQDAESAQKRKKN